MTQGAVWCWFVSVPLARYLFIPSHGPLHILRYLYWQKMPLYRLEDLEIACHPPPREMLNGQVWPEVNPSKSITGSDQTTPKQAVTSLIGLGTVMGPSSRNKSVELELIRHFFCWMSSKPSRNQHQTVTGLELLQNWHRSSKFCGLTVIFCWINFKI